MKNSESINLKPLKRYPIGKDSLSEITHDAGVYLYKDNDDRILYIGKSRKLHDRLESYLAKDLPVKTSQMMSEAKYFSVINVGSEIEALLLESEMVKKFQPKYNIELKDDKHPLYIKITKEKYPRVLTARKNEIDIKADIYGPFPSSSNVRSVLTFLRRIFPYSQHPLSKRACFYYQIHLCDPCPNVIEKEEDKEKKEELSKLYRKNINYIRAFLKGNLKIVRKKLEKDMESLAAKELFEEADEVKKKIEALDYITQPVTPVNYFLENPFYLENSRETEIKELTLIISKFIDLKSEINRIECYDIAHLSGSYPTASMVTFISGEPDKSLYRHFKIRQVKGNDDYSSMKEVARRRKKYLPTWGIPDMILVDGGKGQVKVFQEVFKDTNIPIVGLAKRFERLVIPCIVNGKDDFKLIKVKEGPALHLLQRMRNEAHRFARRYHHLLISKEITKSSEQ